MLARGHRFPLLFASALCIGSAGNGWGQNTAHVQYFVADAGMTPQAGLQVKLTKMTGSSINGSYMLTDDSRWQTTDGNGSVIFSNTVMGFAYQVEFDGYLSRTYWTNSFPLAAATNGVINGNNFVFYNFIAQGPVTLANLQAILNGITNSVTLIMTVSNNLNAQIGALGLNVTNNDMTASNASKAFALTIGLNGTNNDMTASNNLNAQIGALGLNVTNNDMTASNASKAFALTIGLNGTNNDMTASNNLNAQIGTLGLNVTNNDMTASNASKAFTLTIGLNGTNNDMTVSNNLTAQIGTLGLNVTNNDMTASNASKAFALTIGLNGTNNVMTASNNLTAQIGALGLNVTNSIMAASNTLSQSSGGGVSSNSWGLAGNNAVSSAFIGPTNNIPLVMKANNVTFMTATSQVQDARIILGISNSIAGDNGSQNSAILGGNNNFINGAAPDSTAFDGFGHVIVGGRLNTNKSTGFGFIGGGLLNRLQSFPFETIVNGHSNVMASVSFGFIGNGNYNYEGDAGGSLNGGHMFIGTGSNNIVISQFSAILDGLNNYDLQGSQDLIGEGQGNVINGSSHNNAVILNGQFNAISNVNNSPSGYNTILNGTGNNIINNILNQTGQSSLLHGQSDLILNSSYGTAFGNGIVISNALYAAAIGQAIFISGTNSFAFGRNITVTNGNSLVMSDGRSTSTTTNSQAVLMYANGVVIGTNSSVAGGGLAVSGSYVQNGQTLSALNNLTNWANLPTNAIPGITNGLATIQSSVPQNGQASNQVEIGTLSLGGNTNWMAQGPSVIGMLPGGDTCAGGTYVQTSSARWTNVTPSVPGVFISSNGVSFSLMSNSTTLATATLATGPWTINGGFGASPAPVSWIGATSQGNGIHPIGYTDLGTNAQWYINYSITNSASSVQATDGSIIVQPILGVPPSNVKIYSLSVSPAFTNGLATTNLMMQAIAANLFNPESALTNLTLAGSKVAPPFTNSIKLVIGGTNFVFNQILNGVWTNSSIGYVSNNLSADKPYQFYLSSGVLQSSSTNIVPGNWILASGTIAPSSSWGVQIDGLTSGIRFTNIPPSAINSPAGLTNLLFVSTNGNDATALKGRMDRAFSTLTNAVAHAAPGDTVEVLPGTYNITNNIARDQVNWYFNAGATVVYTNPAAIRAGAFSDFGAATSFTIDGQGVFKAYGTINPSFFIFSNATSTVSLNGDSVYAFFSTGGDVMAAITDIGANVSAHFRYIYGQYWGVIWTNGPCFITADTIEGGVGGAVDGQATGTNGDFIVKAGLIKATNTTAIVNASIPGSAMWVAAEIIKGGNQSILNTGGKLYVRAQKLFGSMECDSGLFYVDSDKIENSEGQTGQTLFTGAAGTARIAINHWNDTGDSTAILITGGTNWILGGDCTAPVVTSASGGGVLNMVNFISTAPFQSLNNGAADAIWITLYGCRFSQFAAQDSLQATNYFTVYDIAPSGVTLNGDWSVGVNKFSSGNYDLNSANRVINSPDPVNSGDVVPKGWADARYAMAGSSDVFSSVSVINNLNTKTAVVTNTLFAATNIANFPPAIYTTNFLGCTNGTGQRASIELSFAIDDTVGGGVPTVTIQEGDVKDATNSIPYSWPGITLGSTWTNRWVFDSMSPGSYVTLNTTNQFRVVRWKLTPR